MAESSIAVDELTPLSVKEAKKVIGGSAQYSSSESIAMAVLDFTAIARAHLRSLPRINGSKINEIRI